MGKIRKVLLTQPSTSWANNRPWSIHPYTLALLCAIMPDDYECQALDPNLNALTKEDVKAVISAFAPDVVGISCISLEFARSAGMLTAIIKEINPETVIVLGGVYPTTTPDIALEDPNVDYLILGEGEHRLPKFLEMLNKNDYNFSNFDGIAYKDSSGKVVVNPMTTYIQDLDTLPFPAWDKLDFLKYANKVDRFSNIFLPLKYPYTIMSTSRGCPHHCIYCSAHSVSGRAIRFKSAERVLEEIDWLVNDYGIKEIVFLDDSLIQSRKRFETILKGLIKRDYDLHWKSGNLSTFLLDDALLELMKESKTYQLILPIESGNQDVLTRLIKKPLNLKQVPGIMKKARELGLEVIADFIIGIPGETWDQIRDTVTFADEMNADIVNFHIATPVPTTELYSMAKEQNVLIDGFDFRKFEFFGFAHGCIKTNEFSPEILHSLRAFEWDRINFKTQAKRETFARINGITIEELNAWSKKTIQNAGLYWPETDKALK
ncbi:B12-binding domain-containing radical SAM protein [Candidatus Magnetomonas plexicatena]|uniref:B12-binding domain-containing radical SAM protein n=1 Tax=Candidatus Magnetomonas plexicatena TaxID=2552947 RepID=UPI0011008CB8|nr:radical SAM protein [Nitrospirales bacterium LBB_01]